jgi:hypothetical protein
MTEVVYRPQSIPEYQGNPFLEALPHRLGYEEFCEEFKLQRIVSDLDRFRPASERMELLDTLNGFFVPMPWHFDLYNALHSLIQQSYVNRNPLKGHYWVAVKTRRQSL